MSPTISPPKQRQPCSLPNPESTKSFWHSEPTPLLLGHRSTRNLPSTADVVIIGSGITGTSIAHHLLESNNNDSPSSSPLNVVMLEAREACWGATGRNGGHCQPLLFTHPTEPSIGHFELANLHALEQIISQKSIDCEFVIQPAVQATYDSHGVETMRSALKTMETTAPELLQHMRFITDGEELTALRVPSAKAAIVTDTAARLWPYKLVSHILVDLLTKYPSSSSSSSSTTSTFNLQTLTPVTSLRQSSSSTTTINGEDGISIQTPRGEILTKQVILATNAYTSHLLPHFSDLIVPVRGQMTCLKPVPSLSPPHHNLSASYGFSAMGEEDYLIQRSPKPSSSSSTTTTTTNSSNDEGEGYLLLGGGRSLGNARTVGTTDDSVLDSATETHLRSRLITLFDLPEQGREMDLVGGKGWTGIMGFSRDNKPWIGGVPERMAGKGVWMAAGFTGHGMPNAWLCGGVVAGMCRESFHGEGEEDGEVMEEVCKKTGLPGGYLISEERIRRAMEEWGDVERVDLEEMEVGKRERGETVPAWLLSEREKKVEEGNRLWVDW